MVPRTESPKIREPMVRMMPYMINVSGRLPATIAMLGPSASMPITV